MESDVPTPMPRLLVVEDEAKLASLLLQALSESGFNVTLAHDGEEGRRKAIGQDLAVVDVMMPVMDGFTMVKGLRREGNWIPVLFLTARDMTDDIVTGLTLGGDDYLVKPFRLNELVARVRSLLRRTGTPTKRLQLADILLDLTEKTAYRAGRQLFLSATEFRLLHMLMRQPGQVVSKEEMLKQVWNNEEARHGDNVVEVYVHYLRTKLEAFDQPRVLNTIKGFGYVLEAPSQSH